MALKDRFPKPVFIRFLDGEEIVAKDVMVHDDEGIITYHLLRTNRPAKYERFDVEPGYTAALADIAAADPNVPPRTWSEPE